MHSAFSYRSLRSWEGTAILFCDPHRVDLGEQTQNLPLLHPLRVSGGSRGAEDGARGDYPGCSGAGRQHQRREPGIRQEVQSSTQLDRQRLDLHHRQQDGLCQGKEKECSDNGYTCLQ